MMKLVLFSISILLFPFGETMCPTTDLFIWWVPSADCTLKPEGFSNIPKGQHKTEQELFFYFKVPSWHSTLVLFSPFKLPNCITVAFMILEKLCYFFIFLTHNLFPLWEAIATSGVKV